VPRAARRTRVPAWKQVGRRRRAALGSVAHDGADPPVPDSGGLARSVTGAAAAAGWWTRLAARGGASSWPGARARRCTRARWAAPRPCRRCWRRPTSAPPQAPPPRQPPPSWGPPARGWEGRRPGTRFALFTAVPGARAHRGGTQRSKAGRACAGGPGKPLTCVRAAGCEGWSCRACVRARSAAGARATHAGSAAPRRDVLACTRFQYAV